LVFVWDFKLSYFGLLYGTLAGTVVAFLGAFFHFNRSLRPSFNGRMLLENIKYGLQLVPKTFTSFINRFFDKYMLSKMLSLSVVGVYNIGQTVGNTVFFLMSTSWRAFQPVVFREAFDKGEEGSAAIGRLFTIFSYLTLTPVLLLVLFAQEVIYVFAPPAYYRAIDVIIIILAGITTQVFGEFVSVQYAYSKKPFFVFPITVLGTIVNVVANIILIPRMGLIGAALSMVLSYFTINGLLALVGQRLYRIGYQLKEASSLFLTIAVAIVAVIFLRTAGFSFILVYTVKLLILILFIFNGISARVFTGDALGKIIRAFRSSQKTGEVEA
jgi:O-antigen/teichoic acid export membrane protein